MALLHNGPPTNQPRTAGDSNNGTGGTRDSKKMRFGEVGSPGGGKGRRNFVPLRPKAGGKGAGDRNNGLAASGDSTELPAVA